MSAWVFETADQRLSRPRDRVPELVGRRLLCWGVALLAFAARLVPVLRGGGLFGFGDYDDGVYYSAAVGLVHGRLPYRDFLLLHPPGVLLALAPFAALGRVLGDPTGFALARLAWMVLGALNAVLVMRLLRSQGLFAALLGGFCYAVFFPAVYGEHSTQLEGIATTATLVALLLLSPGVSSGVSSGAARSRWLPLLAGAALGLSAGIKIWGVVAVVVTVVFLLLSPGRRRAGWLVLGAVGATTVVCLPFFLSARGTMVKMVVLDQLGRPRLDVPVTSRLSEIAGLGVGGGPVPTALLVAALSGFVVLGGFAVVRSEARLAVALYVGLTLFLLWTPSWYLHYASLVAGVAAVLVGAGGAQLVRVVGSRLSGLRVAAAVALLALVAGLGAPLLSVSLGQPFDSAQVLAVVRATPGCVTTDDPTTLIETDQLGRNLDRGCPLVVDLGGMSYDDATTPKAARVHDAYWQRYAVTYLQSGSVVLLHRFLDAHGFSRRTTRAVGRWPLLRRVGSVVVRRTSLGPVS